MGAPTLKAKITHNYKRQPARSEKLCMTCNAYVPYFEVQGIGGQFLGLEPRCMILGTKSGRAYRIRPDHGCDRHDNSEYLARLERKERAFK